MVGVVWPRDPLQRVEIEEGLKFKLEWKMQWCDDNNQFTRVNCVACNPQDRVYIYFYFAVTTQRIFHTFIWLLQ